MKGKDNQLKNNSSQNKCLYYYSASANPVEKSPSTAHNGSSVTEEASRFQAHGWSLPSQNYLKSSNINGKTQVNVPVLTYFQPLFDTNDKTQVRT